MKRAIYILAIGMLLGALVLGGILLLPKAYDVPTFQERAGTRYWQLTTGSRIGYTKIEATGPEQKNPILFLHGGPGGTITNPIIEALRPLAAQGHDLYFYDQIGSGHSDRLEDIREYTVNRHRQDLREIITGLGTDEVILIGHSWGACLAINYVAHHPETVEKVVLVGPGPILPVDKARIKEAAPDSLSLLEPAFSNRQGNEQAYNARMQLVSRWAQMFGSKLASDAEADGFFTYLNRELSKSTTCTLEEPKPPTGGGGYYSHIMTVKSFREVEDRRAFLQEVQKPILLIRGQCDNQPWGFTQEYLDVCPQARLEIIEGAGHDVVRSNRATYYALIQAFLDQ